MGQLSTKAATEQVGDIHWVSLQDPGKTDHKRRPAEPRVAVARQLLAAYQKELRVDKPSNRWGSSSGATEPVLPKVHFYEGNEPDAAAAGKTELYIAKHGFYEACHNAWAHHGSLVLSPDDVWLAIQAVFAAYMRVNAEALRTIFVAHEGQKELCIAMDDAPQDWKLFMTRVVAQVTANSKVDMAATFVPPFSSSAEFDTAMKSLAVMDHMQAYFSYTFCTHCGVRRAGLKGTLEDWQLLRTYIEGLRAFAVPAGAKDAYFTREDRTYASWVNDLIGIAEQLIATYKGEPSVAWWNSMITERRTYGSGASTYLKGWIIPLISNRRMDQEMETSDVNSMRFSVPVKRDDNGVTTKLRVLGGFTGTVYDAETDSWTPQRSIAVLDDVPAA